MNKRIPEMLEEIPDGYLRTAKHQGRIESFEYETYDALRYRSKESKMQKRALVYLPYGYDEKKKYNVFYLMHGGGGNEKTYLGKHLGFPKQPFEAYHFQDIIDHALEDGKNYTESFRFADTQKEGNLSYREKKGATHDYAFANEYIYNGLQFLWGDV